MNTQRGILRAIVLGGLAAASALIVKTRRAVERDAPSGAVTRARPSGRRPKARHTPSVTVRVTENGKKYHRENCPLLHGTYRTIHIVEALESYEPCKACHPPGWEA